MSLPTSIDLPLRVNYSDSEDMDRYLRDLVFELQGMYERITDNVNGFIRNYADIDQTKWTPTLNGTVAGTFVYTHQYGWSVRQGIFTKIWFDVQWTSTTAGGNLYLELPYRTTLSNGMPFIGVIQPSSVTYGAGKTNLVINAIPNTYRGEIWTIGSGVATANLAVVGSGRLIGYIDYIGLSDD